MSGKSRAPTRAPEQSAVGPEQQAPESAVSGNAQTAEMLPMPLALPTLGYEILDLLDESLGESEMGLGPVDHSGNGVVADPASPPSGPPAAPGTCDAPDTLDAKDRQLLHQLAKLLTYSGFTDRITFEEILTAQGLVGQLSECGHAQFLALGDGALVDRLLANPEGEGWFANVVGNVADRPEGLLDAAYSWWKGDEALEVAQAAMGGSIDGVTLDTSKDNSVNVGANVHSGTIQATIPNLSIKSIRHASQGATVSSGAGTVLHSVVTLNLPDRASSQLSGSVSIDSIDWTGLMVEAPATTAIIERLVVSSIALSAFQATLDPQTVAKATLTPALARAPMASQLARTLLPQLNLFATLMAPLALAATRTAQDAEVAVREAMELGSVDALDARVDIGSIDLPNGVVVTATAEGGTDANISSLKIEGVALALKQVDRIAALKAQAAQLAESHDVLDQERLASIQEQIAELEPKAIERAELEQRAQSGTLTQAETDTLTLLKRDLSAGMLSLDIRSVTATGIEANGTGAQDIDGKGLKLVAIGDALGVRMQDQPTAAEEIREKQEVKETRLADYDAYLQSIGARPLAASEDSEDSDEASSAPLWSLPEFLDDLDFEGSAQQLSAGGVDTAYGDAGHAGAGGVEFRGNAEVIRVQAQTVDAQGLDAFGVTAGHVSGDRTDIRVSGNDVGGSIQGVSGQDVQYAGDGMTAAMDSAQAGAIRFDADAGTKSLRSAKVDQASATGLDYKDAGQHVVAASASAQTIEASGASASGIDSLTVASGQAADGTYRRNAAPERIGDEGQTIEAVTGVDAAFDAAQIADLRITDATTAGTGTVDLASLDAQGVSGGMDGMGTASADVVSMRTLNASRDGDGAMRGSIDEVTASGAIGQMPGTAYASADEIAIHDITGTGDSAGNYGARAETGSVEGVHVLAPGVAEGTVDSVDLTGLHGGLSPDGSMGAGADVLTAHGIEGEARGYGTGSLESATLRDAEGHLNADGTGGVRTSGGELTTIDGVYGQSLDPTATGHVDSVGFGYAGANFDDEYNITGAEVNDLDSAGISVELLKLPLDDGSEEEAANETVTTAIERTLAHLNGEPAQAPATLADLGIAPNMTPTAAEQPDLFTADAMGGMSGEIHVDIPTSLGAPLTISATATEGFIAMRSIRAGMNGHNNMLTRTVQIDEGRGLVVGIGPTSLSCIFDERDYAGLVSAREGGGRRGSIDIAAFVEGIQNGSVEYSDSGNARLDERRDTRHANREDRDSVAEEQAEERAPRVQARQTRKADRRADRRERKGLEPEVPTVYDGEEGSIQRMLGEYSDDIDVGPSALPLMQLFPSRSIVRGTSFDLGAGSIGYASMSAELANTDSDTFEISGSLDTSLSVGAQEILAESLFIRDALGAPTTFEKAGIRGLKISIDRPLTMDRTITTTIESGTIKRIVYGNGAPDAE